MSPCAVLSCSVMSNSLWPLDWSPLGSSVHVDSPGKNTGVGCHVLLQDIFPTQGSNPGLPHCRLILYQLSYPESPIGSFSSVAQSCLTLCDPMDSSPLGSSVCCILQARKLEWVAMPSSRESSQPRDLGLVSCIGCWILYHWPTS